MKRWVLLFAASLCFSAMASAQAEDNPKFEGFVGYSYLHVEEPGDYLGFENDGTPPLRANLNGASASIAFNPIKYLGLVADVGGYKGTEAGQYAGGNIITYLFGPKLSFQKGRFTPFAQALFGGAHNDFGQSAYAWAAGAGLDWNLNHRFGLRLGQLEYMRTDFFDGITNHYNNIRASAGLVVRF
jgi:opacity protein-like surface antigen